jgi:hypothetical protein
MGIAREWRGLHPQRQPSERPGFSSWSSEMSELSLFMELHLDACRTSCSSASRVESNLSFILSRWKKASLIPRCSGPPRRRKNPFRQRGRSPPRYANPEADSEKGSSPAVDALEALNFGVHFAPAGSRAQVSDEPEIFRKEVRVQRAHDRRTESSMPRQTLLKGSFLIFSSGAVEVLAEKRLELWPGHTHADRLTGVIQFFQTFRLLVSGRARLPVRRRDPSRRRPPRVLDSSLLSQPHMARMDALVETPAQANHGFVGEGGRAITRKNWNA